MKTSYKVLVILLAAAFILAACSPKASEPANLYDKIKKDGKMVVGTSADYAPFESKDDQGNFVGYDMDLIREIGKRMGVKVEIVDMGFDALITALQENKLNAVIASMSATPEREQKVDFTTSYFNSTQTLLGVSGSPIKITDPKDMAKYKVGVQTGTIEDTWITDELVKKNLMPDANVSRYERADQAALDLQAGRIDLTFLDTDPSLQLVSKMGLVVVYTGDIVDVPGAAIALPKGETKLKDEMNKIIADLDKEGFLKGLSDKWNVK